MAKITKDSIKSLRPENGKPAFLWDGELRGFGVRMMPSGVASFLLKYRTKDGRQRKMVLARVGTLTPEEARTLVKKYLGEIAGGADPAAAKSEARKGMTVAELFEAYQAHRKRDIKPSTWTGDQGRAEVHIKPLIGKRLVTSITTKDVTDLQTAIRTGQTAKKRRKGRGGHTLGGEGAAARVTATLSGAFEFARKTLEIIDRNPVANVQKISISARERHLSLDEITRLGKAMRNASAELEPPVGLAAVRFLLLSGCRRMEALALPIEWIDFPARCIRFGDTKTGRQTRPMGASALQALKDAPSDRQWAFPAQRGDGHFVGLPRVLARLAARADIHGISAHVFRHTFASVAAELGFSELVIAGLLGHRPAGVTQRYSHTPDAALLVAADKVSARIAGALDGKEVGKVVPLALARHP
ncbi:tyrosine-type recombinase/integrase [Mesorhizobium xinjiangense]|uniref:tyrosine-type recombinase/integrase n=1 Tax=Mesorhizobium xinjiangense TaxID=2678685 RepID=UPI0012ED308E|nr:site-specific integrase [Mesorhizobium xinjiangense]